MPPEVPFQSIQLRPATVREQSLSYTDVMDTSDAPSTPRGESEPTRAASIWESRPREKQASPEHPGARALCIEG